MNDYKTKKNKSRMRSVTRIICMILGIVLAIAISFAVVFLLTKGICWAFSIHFSTKIAVGIYLIAVVIWLVK